MRPLFSTHMGRMMGRGVSHATRVTVLWSLLVVLAAVCLVSRWVTDHALTADLYEGQPACQVVLQFPLCLCILGMSFHAYSFSTRAAHALRRSREVVWSATVGSCPTHAPPS